MMNENNKKEDKTSVFLCHNNLDKLWVRDIAEGLELEFGIPHFLDTYSIPGGAEFIPWIENALYLSSGCVICLSQAGWGPTHRWEAQIALARYRKDKSFRIIPLLLPGAELDNFEHEELSGIFRDFNWIDFRHWPAPRATFDKLRSAITDEHSNLDKGPSELTPYLLRRDAERWFQLRQSSHIKHYSMLYRGHQLNEALSMAETHPMLLPSDSVMPFLTSSTKFQRNKWKLLAVVSLTVLISIGVFYSIAELSRQDRERLADPHRLKVLTESAAQLWKLNTSRKFQLEDWLEQANQVSERIHLHKVKLNELRIQSHTPSNIERAARYPKSYNDMVGLEKSIVGWQEKFKIDRGNGREPLAEDSREVYNQKRRLEALNEKTNYYFDSQELQWQHDNLAGYLKSYEIFSNPEKGVIASVNRRLKYVNSVVLKTLDEPASNWDTVIEDIKTAKHYNGLILKPLRGLIPLGKDSTSQLHEFLHYQSHEGPLPQRDSQGELVISDKTGLIFVLLPEGQFWMGSQSEDALKSNFDPDSKDDEQPIHLIELAPFLLSKYELSMGQWFRLTNQDLRYKLRHEQIQSEMPYPLNGSERNEVKKVLTRALLNLPTEAQWEYAARGRNSKLQSPASEVFYANSVIRKPGTKFIEVQPIDKGEVNTFGFLNMIGNVSEWCEDSYLGYGFSVRPFDGLRQADLLKPNSMISNKVRRGGHYNSDIESSRVADRKMNNNHSDYTGVRPAINLMDEQLEKSATMISSKPTDILNAQDLGLTIIGKNEQGFIEYSLNKDPSVLFIHVPANQFNMGSWDKTENSYYFYKFVSPGSVKPEFVANLPSYFIAKYEITQKQFGKFINDTNYDSKIMPIDQQLSEHPVSDITFMDALAYCRWAGCSLPTTTQWVYAARGNSSYKYLWGNKSSNEYEDGFRANTIGVQDGYQNTSPVGSFPSGVGFVGTYDQVGNVWEYSYNYFIPNNLRVAMGGSFRTGLSAVVAESRILKANEAPKGMGFRPVINTVPEGSRLKASANEAHSVLHKKHKK